MSDNKEGATNGASKYKFVGGACTINDEKEITMPPENAKEVELSEGDLVSIPLIVNDKRDIEYLGDLDK